ncbi:MAG: GAF and ANTAR domain-containing protein, partial [Jatrophihabitantaceae bacterium]
GRLGVHSALSVPLLLPGQLIGAINIYARGKQGFDERAAELGELFAGPAAVAVHDAQVLAQARELTGQLQAALTSRPIIDQAVGILRARTGATADEALQRLRSISQRDNVKLACVAEQLVDESVRRARARRGESGGRDC